MDSEEATDEADNRCQYVGPTGIRCRNAARPGSAYCGLHEQIAEAAGLDVSDDPDSLI
jgi:N utilization substance protein A